MVYQLKWPLLSNKQLSFQGNKLFIQKCNLLDQIYHSDHLPLRITVFVALLCGRFCLPLQQNFAHFFRRIFIKQ